MVHPGRPSRACQTCRQRRIKCDESTPACSQCIKSRRTCPGYKHPFDLVLRNETLSTAARVRPPTTVAVPPPPPPQHEHQALCFFISNYVLLPHASERAYLDYLLPLYSTGSPLLSHAVSAVSLAALGSTHGAQRLLPQARSYYTKALASTNAALRDPQEVKSDQTLVTVILMTLYESLCWTPHSLKSWSSHISGACALLKLRGKAQLNTEIMSSLCCGEPVDPFLKEWTYEPVADNAIVSGVTKCLLVLPDLLRDAKAVRNMASAKALLEAVEVVDARLVEWPRPLPMVWRYWRGKDVEEEGKFWGGSDMYLDIWIASVWNYYRTARIFAHALRMRCLGWLGDVGTRHDESVQVLREMVDQICASLPYHMDKGVLGGHFLLWPLLVAVNVDVVEEAQKKWIKGQLEVIGGMGIGQARAEIEV